MNYTDLVRNPYKTKPETNRASRQKTSNTPSGVLRMNYNENHYGMSKKAQEVIKEYATKGNLYPDFFAIDFKKAVGKKYDVDWGCIAPAAGASPLIDMLGEVFLNEGDEFIFGDPTFEAFRDVANDFGAVTVPVPLDKDMKFDLDAMLNAITDKTKMIIIVNPNNPTGTFVESAKVEEFIRKVPENIVVVVDEAYLEYCTALGTYSMIKMIREGYEKPLVVLKTFSKIYAMAGVRCGFACMPEGLVAQFSKSAHEWNVSSIAQYAAIAAMSDQEHIDYVIKTNEKERNYVEAELSKLGCKVWHSETNFILFDTKIAPQILKKKLEDRKVLITTPAGYNRVSVGTRQMNDTFLSCMEEILSEEASEIEKAM